MHTVDQSQTRQTLRRAERRKSQQRVTDTGSTVGPAGEPRRRTVPLSVLIPAKNEAKNLGRCLGAVSGWADEVVVVDSQSTDGTIELARDRGASVIQFHYEGGWPKKRQWALDTYDWKHDWILLLDADEILTDELKTEIEQAIENEKYNGYWIRLRIVFLGRVLRYGDTELKKLSLFRKGGGRYECRLEDQDNSMLDMEVHEHVLVDGPTSTLKNPIHHENIHSLDRYIAKHNGYSNWEARVLLEKSETALQPRLFGNQAQRRRWLKQTFFRVPGSPLLRFLYIYILRGGFLDGRPGLIYAMFKFIQSCHVKAKIYELTHASTLSRKP